MGEAVAQMGPQQTVSATVEALDLSDGMPLFSTSVSSTRPNSLPVLQSDVSYRMMTPDWHADLRRPNSVLTYKDPIFVN